MANDQILDIVLCRYVVTARFAFRNATHEERLLLYLFNDYDTVARAVMDINQTVTVIINFVLLRIHGLVSRITMIDRSTHTPNIAYRCPVLSVGFIQTLRPI